MIGRLRKCMKIICQVKSSEKLVLHRENKAQSMFEAPLWMECCVRQTRYDSPATFCQGILTMPRNSMEISLVAQNEKRFQFCKVQLFKNTFLSGVSIYNHILISIISGSSTKMRNNQTIWPYSIGVSPFSFFRV